MTTRKQTSVNRLDLFYFLFAAILLITFTIGCSGSKSMASPNTYNPRSHAKADTNNTETDKDDKEAENDREHIKSLLGQDSSDYDRPSHKVEKKKTTEYKSKLPQNTTSGEILDDVFYNSVDIDDSATAVDDAIWRQFDLADEYYSMGVIANREASWEEAQYYFEKSLRILAELDVETDTVMTPEAAKYSEVLENVISDYRVTLRSLGTLTEDVSASVLVERFGNIASKMDVDTMLIFRDELEKDKVTYDLPIVMNDRVKKSIVYFQTTAKNAFNKYLRRSKKYTPMMKRILNKHGLPEDLIYLSLVESGYNPHAYSWARAMGLWQFISSTGRAYDLDRSWWIDERKDPIKSTEAACRFLKDLYREFGDWELAMAAYNGGPGRVRRTIKKMKTDDFWKLKLKRQTMDYVPLIMAATIIAKDPAKYGFTDIEHEPEIVWDEVKINKCLELSVVAKELGCSTKELEILNPELLRKYTPPSYKNYILKVPKGTSQKFFAAYDNMPSPKETSWVQHKIKRGETISSIASKYGVSQYAIKEANNMGRSSRIYAGKKVIVPVPLDRDYFASKKNKKSNYSAKNSIYVVRAGDTMWDIARAFGTTVSSLRQLNYIGRGSRIYVGQKMKIPSNAKNLKNKNSNSSGKTYASTSASKSSNKSSGSSGAKSYKVKSGDTLWDIARMYGTTTTKIRNLNGLGRSSRIYPGQKLKVEGNADYVIHKVRRGETLSSIASRYRTSVSRIRALNNIDNPNMLRIGTSLKIY